MSSRRRQAYARGFTLIELLIVVVIIGVLAAIAIPKFNDSKRKAQVTAMKSALRTAISAAEAHFADQNTYVGLTLPAAGPVVMTPQNATPVSVWVSATHSSVPDAMCLTWLGDGALVVLPAEAISLRPGAIGGADCQ
jgi:prepilin-type N-terminal cleavage/methylation domain-containing protein